jgi:2',3'-cyclic-nucleotide 2'-phosphodiesterase (5'-nucleotidase family)
LKGFTVISPGDALDRLLPEVRGKADLVILLSQLGEARTLALVEAARGIDVAVSSRSGSVLKVKPPENAAVILDAGSEGLTMGLVTITLDGKRVLSVSEGRDVPLDLSVPDNKRILGLVETYKKEQAIKEEKMEKERMEWLQLTPEEFIKRYRERQTEQKKGAAQ